MRKEILTSPNFEIVLKVLEIPAKRVFCFSTQEGEGWPYGFEIWDVPGEALEDMLDMSDRQWNSIFPNQWWRSSTATSLEDSGLTSRMFIINGKEITCWENPEKLQDYIFEEEDGQEYVDEREYCYDDLLQYCSEEWGIGTPKNVCAVCEGLAKLNGMKLSELFSSCMRDCDKAEYSSI